MRAYRLQSGKVWWLRGGVFSLLVALAGCDRETIIHGLSERDANRLVTELHGEGIKATRRSQSDGRYSLEVEERRAMGALRFLESNRLVREATESKSGGGTFGATREDRRFHYERSISRELERTLERMPGIREARVHLNLSAAESLFNRGEDAVPPSASVLVVTSPRADVNREALARLIGGAAGIDMPRVTVVVQAATNSPEGEQDIVPTAPEKQLALAGWSHLSALDPSRRWMLVLAIIGAGLILIGFGVRAPRRVVRSVHPHAA